MTKKRQKQLYISLFEIWTAKLPGRGNENIGSVDTYKDLL